MRANIAVIPGDGIGSGGCGQAVNVLSAVAKKYGHAFEFESLLAGGCAIDATGHPLPQATLDTAKASDAVLLGAVGGWQWDSRPGNERPEMALMGLRGGLELFANLRPAILYPQLASACPLKEEISHCELDVLVVRELTGGIYFGKRGRDADGAYDTMYYSRREVERIAKVAMEAAMKRNKKVMSVDKANILESSRLWREVVIEVAKDYPEIELMHMYVDNAAMQLVRNPGQFDVIVTENMFGDILSDEASMLTGSIGMLPSASLGSGRLGMYEPIHGSAPDIAGKSIANPLATILSAAMLLRYSLDLEDEAMDIENAVKLALSDGLRTADIALRGETVLSTTQMGAAVTQYIGG